MAFSIKELLSAFLMFGSVLLIQGAAQDNRGFSTVYFAMQEKLADKADCCVEISDISCNPICPVDVFMRAFKEDRLVEQTKNLPDMNTNGKTLYSGVFAQVNLYGEAEVVITPKPDYSSISSHKSQSKRDAKLLEEIWDISRELSRFLLGGSVYRLRLNLCEKERSMQDLRVHFISQSKIALDRFEKATEVLTALKTGIGRVHGQAQFKAVFDESLFAEEQQEEPSSDNDSSASKNLDSTDDDEADDTDVADAEVRSDAKEEEPVLQIPVQFEASENLDSTDNGNADDTDAADAEVRSDEEEEPVSQIPVQSEELKKPSISFASKVLVGLGVVVVVAATVYCVYSWWAKKAALKSDSEL